MTLQFLFYPLVWHFIEGFGKIEKYNIHILARVQTTSHFIQEGKKNS